MVWLLLRRAHICTDVPVRHSYVSHEALLKRCDPGGQGGPHQEHNPATTVVHLITSNRVSAPHYRIA
jgi:hypothetical protein